MEPIQKTPKGRRGVVSEIKTVLLVPTEGDPHGLLKEGPCGARPPTAAFWMCRQGHQEHGTWMGIAGGCPHPDHEGRLRPLRIGTGLSALVLAWDGKPVAEGMDRAARVDPHYRGEAWASARNLGQEMERLKYGTLVLIDAEGREVSDE
jgi:hypothetical protein